MESTDEPYSELMHALSALYDGGKYSDLTIVCKHKKWLVHKAVVCSRSGFFDASMSHSFRETQSGIVDLSEDDLDAVEQMIYYFYHLDYLVERDTTTHTPTLFRHRAYSNARKRLSNRIDFSQIEDPLLSQAGAYSRSALPVSPPQSPELGIRSKRHSRKISSSRFSMPPLDTGVALSPTASSSSQPNDHDIPNVSENDNDHIPHNEDIDGIDAGSENYDDDDEYDDEEISNYDQCSAAVESHLILHARVYALAEKYDVAALKPTAARKFETAMACFYDAPEFADAIAEAYTTTADSDRGLRDIVLQVFRSHPQLVTTQDVYAVIAETPTLALELFKMERGLPI